MHKSKLRQYISSLSNKELWDIFDEIEMFEKTGNVGDNDRLWLIATEHLSDITTAKMVVAHEVWLSNTTTAMMVVAHEVWRELAQRGAAYTM
jgi:hypothetical protein